MVAVNMMTNLLSDLKTWLDGALEEAVDKDALSQCGEAVTSILSTRPEEVKELAHAKLHTWPFKDVPLCWRRAYEEASLYEAAKFIDQFSNFPDQCKKRHRNGDVKEPLPSSQSVADKFVPKLSNILDMAIILTGAPGRRLLIDTFFKRLQHCQEVASPEAAQEAAIPTTFPPSKSHPLSTLTSPIPFKSSLSLAQFQRHLDTAGGPLVVGSTTTDWPASTLWSSPAYLHRLTLSGHRLVPVELGKSYTSSSWSQRIMPFSTFLHDHLLSPSPTVGYLAQHDLLDQLPALAADTEVPDLCFAEPPIADGEARLDFPLRNAWLGPAGTVSPLHTDPWHNLLCQVVGRKYVRLYAPSQTKSLYPRGVDEAGVSMANTAGVDVQRAREVEVSGDAAERKALEGEFPGFLGAEYVECVLEAGQGLYIPKGWWHYVESLEVSFNVSYWFN